MVCDTLCDPSKFQSRLIFLDVYSYVVDIGGAGILVSQVLGILLLTSLNLF